MHSSFLCVIIKLLVHTSRRECVNCTFQKNRVFNYSDDTVDAFLSSCTFAFEYTAESDTQWTDLSRQVIRDY